MSEVTHVHHYHSRGIGLGAILAVILSWVVNHSILWCILHFFLGWLYVIYWALEYGSNYIK